VKRDEMMGLPKRAPSIRCPRCRGGNTWVRDTKYTEEVTVIRRYRLCGDCGRSFRTHERVVEKVSA
jgi:transcriptional regulator NrdR family protein